MQIMGKQGIQEITGKHRIQRLQDIQQIMVRQGKQGKQQIMVQDPLWEWGSDMDSKDKS